MTHPSPAVSLDEILASIIAFSYCQHPEQISDALDYAEKRRAERGELTGE